MKSLHLIVNPNAGTRQALLPRAEFMEAVERASLMAREGRTTW